METEHADTTQMNAAKGITGIWAHRPPLLQTALIPNGPGSVQGRGAAGDGGGTDQHEEEDEGHDVGHVRHRLQDDTNDPGQGLHRHAHMHQTKNPVAEPLRGASWPFPDPSSPLPLPPAQTGRTNPSW